MTIRQIGGVFGRNPTFNDVEAKTLEVSGPITSGGDPTFEGSSGRSLTLKNTSAAATAGDLIGEVLFYGSDASAPGAGIKSKIKVIADGGSGDGSRLFISTSDGVTNDIDRMEFTKDGDVKVLTGNVVMANGKGIDFSATSGTGTSELFDDYEEGTFTPEVEGTSSSGTYTYATQSGVYTKVGDLVTVTINLVDITASVAGSGSLEITGLPFSSSGTHTGSVWARSVNFDGSAAYLVPYSSATSIYINEVVDNASGGSVNVADLTSGSARLYITVTYKV